jgi:hypothetical protein
MRPSPGPYALVAGATIYCVAAAGIGAMGITMQYDQGAILVSGYLELQMT